MDLRVLVKRRAIDSGISFPKVISKNFDSIRYMLRSKPIRSERLEDDGLRISVMSRHTLNDGITPDDTISRMMYDEWWPDLAPPAKLLGAYYKRGLSWIDFEEAYTEHLWVPRILDKIHELSELAVSNNVTILCVEDSPDKCHRRLITEHCRLFVPQLEIELH